VSQNVGGRPYRDALRCLKESGVRYALLRDDPEHLDDLADLDLLIDDQELDIAFAAMERAGFLRKHTPQHRRKWLFIRYEAERFYALDVHGAFVQNGIEYMDAGLALKRCDFSGREPQLGAEDRFVHILLHNLIGKRRLQEKHLPQLRALLQGGLDRDSLESQAQSFGTARLIEVGMVDINVLANDPRSWNRLRRQARRVLLAHGDNRQAAWRFRWRSRRRWRQRPVILSLLGPDGSGKTSITNELEELLRGTPLSAGRVYMGCWGHDLLPMRFMRRLIPPRISHQRIWQAVRGRAVSLTEEERQFVEQKRPGVWAQGWRALRTAIKDAAFYAALLLELTTRFLRGIQASQRPMVLSDRWVYDLEFRQGRVPFTHHERVRAWIYRHFPVPDGILYLSAPYSVVAARKPQLNKEQYETMDLRFRQVLKPYKPLELVTDVTARQVAHTFLDRYWTVLLDRFNAQHR
jgi:thymidylate kinase